MTDLTRTRRRLPLPSLHLAGWRVPVAALAIYAVASWLILRANGNPPIHFRFDPTGLIESTLAIRLHVAGALAAFGIGAVLLSGVKGTRMHRLLGYTWVAAMAVTAISSFFIFGLNGHNFSPIHGLSAWTVIVLPMAVVAARRRNIRKHATDMRNLFMGGLLVAGLFTFLPGRMIWSIFFGA
ncbi:MAG TPA: DUF2306 domain-containing protein [Hyphomonas sp.]|nr:DUF2306 domain-containing protein [Hyphomonas sp.]MCA8904878.1 DUF2306 domain-containing protein [Hyphomonas sp.]MCB9963280.1 DUF2306 domain-containing protein [Hyphomonas sp.]MCB9972389.1 DUF2306 domain-containing protein [Hyphomonas sp.]HPE47938.1 DUF2306 domain-containing protein [Hyphomonas sp.]